MTLSSSPSMANPPYIKILGIEVEEEVITNQVATLFDNAPVRS